MKKTISLLLSAVILLSAFFALPTASAEMQLTFIKGSNQELLDMLNKLDPELFVSDYEKMGITEEQFEEIKAAASDAAASAEAETDYDRLKAVCSWICENIEYDSQLTGGSQDAYSVFSQKIGVCQGYSNLTTAMCAALDIPCIMVNGDSSAGGHAWSMAYADNRWIFIDNTWTIDWFDKDIDTFSKEHKPYYCDDIKIKEGDFVFTYFNGVAPCLYVGEGTDWVIPSIAVNMPVTGVSYNLFSIDSTVETLYIPETVKNLEYTGLINCPELKKIEVAEENADYASVDGVLFDKAVSNLLIYPTGKEETSFAIPDTVTALGESVFEKNTNLTDVLIPASVTYIGKAPFNDNSKITIYADEGTYGYEFAQSNGIACEPVSEFGKEEQPEVDKSGLSALAEEMSKVVNVYTVNSYRSFTEAMVKASDVLKDENADSAAVEEAAAALQAAYEGLKYNTGDVNHSGGITVDDATLIQRYLCRQALDNFDESLADADGKNGIVVTDATICQLVAAGHFTLDDDGNIMI